MVPAFRHLLDSLASARTVHVSHSLEVLWAMLGCWLLDAVGDAFPLEVFCTALLSYKD